MRVEGELLSSRFEEYNSSLNALLAIISLISGLIAGFALLSYSGKMPVNVIYYSIDCRSYSHIQHCTINGLNIHQK